VKASVLVDLTPERALPKKLILWGNDAATSTAMVVQSVGTRGAFQENHRGRIVSSWSHNNIETGRIVSSRVSKARVTPAQGGDVVFILPTCPHT